MKILVIKLSALGDFILSCGTFAAIRAHHPEAHITLMTTKGFAGMAAQSPFFDAVWTVGRPGLSGVADWWDIRARLHGERFDAVYDLQRNDRTRIMKILVPRATAARWLGGPKGSGADAADRYAVPAGMLDTRTMDAFPTRDLAWLRGKPPEELGLDGRYVLIAAGSAPQHPGKRWPAGHYAALAVRLAAAGYQPALIGTVDEAAVNTVIKQAAPQAVDMTGKTSIADLSGIAPQAVAAIGNDTGPMHIVSAAGCPVVSLFSHLSHPDQSAPRGAVVKVLRDADMADIAVDDVFGAFEEIKRR